MKSREAKKQNKMGFTLVELLVAITILGIILVIALPQVSNIQSENKTKKYEKYAESLKTAAKLYIDSYSKDMFITTNCETIYYRDLKAKNLAKDIKVDDANCNTYAADGTTPLTYVKVYKDNENYSYEVAIKCVNSNDTVLYEKTISGEGICNGAYPDEESPILTISPNGHDWYTGKDQEVEIKISDEEGMAENTKVEYGWLKEGDSKTSLTYKTLNFNNARGAGKEESPLIKKIKVPQGVTGKYKLIIKTNQVKDINDNYMSGSIESKVFKFDNSKSKITVHNSKDGIWTKDSVTITANAIDDDSGISKIYYTYTNSTTDLKDDWTETLPSGNSLKTTKVFTEEINSSVYIVAEDMSGNKSEPIPAGKLLIDKTGPTCTVTKGNTTWTKNDVPVEFNCDDNGSGCVTKNYKATATNSGKTNDFEMKDKVGNIGICKPNVYIDKTPPSCGTATNTSTTWRNTPTTITQNCNDAESGCQSSSYSVTYDNKRNAKTDGVEISDKAGNSAYCTYDVYVDTIAPYTPYVEPVEAYVINNNGSATMKGYSCATNEKNSTGVNICNAEFEYKCKVLSMYCVPDYGFRNIKVTNDMSGINWEYHSTFKSEDWWYGLHRCNEVKDWNRTSFGFPDKCEYLGNSDLDIRAVDAAGNIGNYLRLSFNIKKKPL